MIGRSIDAASYQFIHKLRAVQGPPPTAKRRRGVVEIERATIQSETLIILLRVGFFRVEGCSSLHSDNGGMSLKEANECSPPHTESERAREPTTHDAAGSIAIELSRLLPTETHNLGQPPSIDRCLIIKTNSQRPIHDPPIKLQGAAVEGQHHPQPPATGRAPSSFSTTSRRPSEPSDQTAHTPPWRTQEE